MHKSLQSGFTLIEIMLVIGILSVLVGIVIAAINPLEQLNNARGTERASEAQAIENALTQSTLRGAEYTGIPTIINNAIDICKRSFTGSVCTGTHGGYDLSPLVPDYIADIPVDSSQSGTVFTGYRLYKNGAFYEVCSQLDNENCGP